MMLPQTCALDDCRECSKRIQLYTPKYRCPRCATYPLCGECVNYPIIRKAAPAPAQAATSALKIEDTAATQGAVVPAAADGTVAVPQAVAAPVVAVEPKDEVHSVCLRCFKESTKLNFAETFDVYGPAKGEAVTVLLVHGGGACRKMMQPAAQHLASNGFRCVAPDLPGHGALVHVVPTLENCIETLERVYAEQCAADSRGVLPIYFGVNFGAYVGMELVGKKGETADKFSAAIFAAATQAVGRGAGIPALCAFGGMSLVSNFTWAEHMTKVLQTTIQRQKKYLDEAAMDECFLSCGTYFTHFKQQVAVLRQCDSQAAMNRFYYPVLYISGELDYRDMAEELVEISREKEMARMRHKKDVRPTLTDAVVYPQVSYFMGFDSRSQARFHEDVLSFARRVVDQSRPLRPL